ncbi:MAG: hypothetical protein IJ920_00715 [Paludibacteraceae bacterium]|nr:hypothetical protein [Paludibacteraceae bacterium]
MVNRTPELEQLLLDVEEKFGKHPSSPADYKELILAILKETNERLSESTIQRLWGYIQAPNKIRTNTLVPLTRYVGFRDWEEYLQYLYEKMQSNANHILDGAICARDLGIGRLVGVQIGFRQYVFRYLGNKEFQVVEAKHSMLKKGDIFETSFFMEGRPLYLDNWRSEGEAPKVYAAGGGAGLRRVWLINGDLNLPSENDSSNMLF